MSKEKKSFDDETKILNKCPSCGEQLEYNSLHQYTEDDKEKLPTGILVSMMNDYEMESKKNIANICGGVIGIIMSIIYIFLLFYFYFTIN